MKEDYEELFHAVDEYGNPYAAVKWYSHEKDMKRLSLQFPDTIFKLHADGEAAGAICEKTF